MQFFPVEWTRTIFPGQVCLLLSDILAQLMAWRKNQCGSLHACTICKLECRASLMAHYFFHIYLHMYLINWSYNNNVHSQSLLWGALSVVLSPLMCSKINSQILNFVLVNIMKSLGSRCIPFQVYTRFVAYCMVICTLCACHQEAAEKTWILGCPSDKQLSKFACLGLVLVSFLFSYIVARQLPWAIAHWASKTENVLVQDDRTALFSNPGFIKDQALGE